MAGDLGIGGVFAEGAEEVVGEASGHPMILVAAPRLGWAHARPPLPRHRLGRAGRARRRARRPPHRLDLPDGFPADVLAEADAAVAATPPPDGRPARARVRHGRSRRVDGPRPGPAPRTAPAAATSCTTRSRTSRASCDADGADRPRGPPARADAVRGRRTRAAASAGPRARTRLAAARRRSQRLSSGPSSSTRRRVRDEHPARARDRALARAAELCRGAGAHRRRRRRPDTARAPARGRARAHRAGARRAAARASTCPTRRSCAPPTAATRSSDDGCSRSRSGTRSSRS